MSDPASTVTLRHQFEPPSNTRLANLCGPLDRHLRRVEEALGVSMVRRGGELVVRGRREAAQRALGFLQVLYERSTAPWSEADFELAVAEWGAQPAGESARRTRAPTPRRADDTSPPADSAVAASPEPVLHTRRSELRGRTPNQGRYLRQMLSEDITFGIGPAGTGKTFLAVACAVDALERQSVQRLVLTRPAVEAGERLGFLPGDLAQKVDPYLRPLYDALYELMGFERVGKAFEKGLIEIAPLAFMRGRTLNHAFVILDEAQNTTREQMKMFLTRLGFGSRCVVTGDTSQVDLPPGVPSGLVDARQVLGGVAGIGFTEFTAADVVRHPLVARIVEAYEAARPGGAGGVR